MRRENGIGSIFQYVLLVLMIVALVVVVFINYRANSRQQEEYAAQEAAAETTPTPAPTSTPEPTPTPSRNTETVTLAFSGDVVAQAGLTTAAESTDGDTVRYDYSDELAGVTSTLEGADLAACTFVGTIHEESPYDAYQMNPAIAAALSVSGFQMVNAATDHILDSGLSGLVDTVDYLSDEGLQVAGAHSSQDTSGFYIRDVNGVNVAFLSYSYGTGDVSVADNTWCIDLFTTDYMTNQASYDRDRITSDISLARENGADVIVCFLYWWNDTQYYTEIRDKQETLADYLCENGVDIVIGSGIKTPQPIDFKTVTRSDGSKANCVVCYSLSSLLSCFSDPYTNLSATALIDITHDTDSGETWISGVSYRPLFMLDTNQYPATAVVTPEPDDETEDSEDTEENTDEEETEEDNVLPSVDYALCVLDAYQAVEDYENGDTSLLTNTAYEAVMTGILDLQTIIGAGYDEQLGGVQLDYPY